MDSKQKFFVVDVVIPCGCTKMESTLGEELRQYTNCVVDVEALRSICNNLERLQSETFAQNKRLKRVDIRLSFDDDNGHTFYLDRFTAGQVYVSLRRVKAEIYG